MEKSKDMMEFLAVPREGEISLLYLRGEGVHPDCGQKDPPKNAEEIQIPLKTVRKKLEGLLSGFNENNTCFGRTPCWPGCVLKCGAREQLFDLLRDVSKGTSPDVGTT